MNTHTDDIAGIWPTIRHETEQACAEEPALAGFLHLNVLRHEDFEHVLAFHLAGRLGCAAMDARLLNETFIDVIHNNPDVATAALYDILACYRRDAACDLYSLPLLYFKGYHALQSHRINHCLWKDGRRSMAYFLQNRASEVFGVDIHPAARFGRGLMIDHGTGVVIGETVILGDDISILHGVTLGGSGKESGDRHPKIGNGVMIGANASVLGNIRVGCGAKIGAGSVVVNDVPEHSTVVGIPARAKKQTFAAEDMDWRI